MAAYKEFLAALETGIRDLAAKTGKEFAKDAQSDAREFLTKTEEDLKRWTKLLAKGQLTKDEFEWLVEGKQDLAKMRALKLAGLAQVRIDRFRNALMDLIVDTAFAVFL
jgi:hypothetical protein